MNRSSCLFAPLVFCVAATTGAVAGQSGDVGRDSRLASDDVVAAEANARANPERPPVEPVSFNDAGEAESNLLPLPPGQPSYHHYYNMATGVLTDAPPPQPSVAGPVTSIKVYSNTPPPTFIFPTFGGELGDDIHSIAVGGCDVSMYEIQMVRSIKACSNNGNPCENDSNCFGAATCDVRPDPGFATTVALYDTCPGNGGQLIAGTEATIAVAENGIHTLTIDLSGTPIFVDSSFWIVLTTDKPKAGVTVGGPASIGFTNNVHHVETNPCDASFAPTPIFAGYHVEVYCLDDSPVGACCDLAPLLLGTDDPLCRETHEITCNANPVSRRWSAGATCDDPLAFDPPCGTVACCVPEPMPRGFCHNLTPSECTAQGGIADFTRFCEPDASHCGWFPCLQQGQDCCLAGQGAGCTDNACCNRTCDLDTWCCEVAWDEVCADEAQEFCGSGCASGSVTWVDPPNGVIDARQPHPPFDNGIRQGIESIDVVGPTNTGACCWRLCSADSAITLSSVINLFGNAQRLVLGMPLPSGSGTRVVYRQTGASADFVSHPGDVNGDEETNPGDAVALTESLAGDAVLPWMLFSCDINRSGECEPADLLRLIDLLHGGATYTPWNNTTRPIPPQDCP